MNSQFLWFVECIDQNERKKNLNCRSNNVSWDVRTKTNPSIELKPWQDASIKMCFVFDKICISNTFLLNVSVKIEWIHKTHKKNTQREKTRQKKKRRLADVTLWSLLTVFMVIVPHIRQLINVRKNNNNNSKMSIHCTHNKYINHVRSHKVIQMINKKAIAIKTNATKIWKKNSRAKKKMRDKWDPKPWNIGEQTYELHNKYSWMFSHLYRIGGGDSASHRIACHVLNCASTAVMVAAAAMRRNCVADRKRKNRKKSNVNMTLIDVPFSPSVLVYWFLILSFGMLTKSKTWSL